MSQTSLIDKIKADAAKTVADIEAAAAAEIETIVREGEAAVAALKTEQAAVIDKAVAHAALVASSKAKQAGNIAFQEAKRKEIDALFAAFEATFRDLDEAAYVAFVSPLAASLIPAKTAAVRVVAPKGRAKETKEVLKELHIDAPVTEGAITAGLVVHAADGVYDASLDRLLGERRPALEIELMKLVQA